MIIRPVNITDVPALLEIYAPYVEHTAVTFEYDVPSAEEFAQRIQAITERYPYLLAEEEGVVTGYAYASAFKNRAAYDWSVEVSVYVRRDARGLGIGKALYQSLEACLSMQHVYNLCACIAYPNPESIGFHQHFGYRTVAHFTKSGYKAGKWYDMIWMEKFLHPHPDVPEPFIPFQKLPFPATKEE